MVHSGGNPPLIWFVFSLLSHSWGGFNHHNNSKTQIHQGHAAVVEPQSATEPHTGACLFLPPSSAMKERIARVKVRKLLIGRQVFSHSQERGSHVTFPGEGKGRVLLLFVDANL